MADQPLDTSTQPLDTSTRLAVDRTRMAAERGLPVICQKPMTPTLAEAEAMLADCRAAGVPLFIHENWRWQPWYRERMGKTFNLLVRLVVMGGIKDTQCGFKLFKQKVAKQLFSKQLINRFGFDFEILFLAQKKGYSIKELPVVWVNAEGSKVKPTDYFRTFGELLKIRFNQIKGKYN